MLRYIFTIIFSVTPLLYTFIIVNISIAMPINMHITIAYSVAINVTTTFSWNALTDVASDAYY